MKKIIFLDIDGVLNTASSSIFWKRKLAGPHKAEMEQDEVFGYTHYFCLAACSNLQFILDECPEAEIVISSTWRKYMPLERIRSILERNGVTSSDRVIGKTPVSFGGDRGHEIGLWLRENPTETYVIIDDAHPSFPHKEKWVNTHPYNGLTTTQAFEAATLLGVEKLPVYLF